MFCCSLLLVDVLGVDVKLRFLCFFSTFPFTLEGGLYQGRQLKYATSFYFYQFDLRFAGLWRGGDAGGEIGKKGQDEFICLGKKGRKESRTQLIGREFLD